MPNSYVSHTSILETISHLLLIMFHTTPTNSDPKMN